MKQLFLVVAFGSLLFIPNSPSLGSEVAKPKPQNVTIAISHDPKTPINRLIIPKDLLPQLSVQMVPQGTVPSATSEPSAPSRRSQPFDLRTILAGLALSAAAVSLLVVVRGNPRYQYAAVGFIGIAIVVAVARWANADVPPPPYWDFHGHGVERRDFQIEIGDLGDEIKLIWGKPVYQSNGPPIPELVSPPSASP